MMTSTRLIIFSCRARLLSKSNLGRFPEEVAEYRLLHGADPKAVAEAHAADVALQAKYGVEYTKYWLNKEGGKLFCLCHAPSADAAERVHREAHGLVAERIMRVDADVAEAFLGDGTDMEGEARIGDKRDTAIRTVVFTDIVESTSLTQRVGDTVAEASDFR